MDGVPGGFDLGHHAPVERDAALLDLDAIPAGQRGMGVAPHQHHELPAPRAVRL
jgi:hypothetical protein